MEAFHSLWLTDTDKHGTPIDCALDMEFLCSKLLLILSD